MREFLCRVHTKGVVYFSPGKHTHCFFWIKTHQIENYFLILSWFGCRQQMIHLPQDVQDLLCYARCWETATLIILYHCFLQSYLQQSRMESDILISTFKGKPAVENILHVCNMWRQ